MKQEMQKTVQTNGNKDFEDITAVWCKLERCGAALYAAGQALEELKQDKLVRNAVFGEMQANSIRVGELAEVLKQHGIAIGPNQLFAWMRSNGYLLRQDCGRNRPTPKSIALGLMESKQSHDTSAAADGICEKTARVTPTGQQYFLELFLTGNAV